ELDGEIVIPASYQLGRTLIEHDLVDALRLVGFPVVLGAGERFFSEDSDKRPMRLVDTKGIGDGLVLLNYEFIREGWEALEGTISRAGRGAASWRTSPPACQLPAPPRSDSHRGRACSTAPPPHGRSAPGRTTPPSPSNRRDTARA